MKTGYIYITANEKDGVLYVGVTSILVKRIWEHKNTINPLRLNAKYNCKKLMYYEVFDNTDSAILRGKQINNWHRDWKI